MNIFLPPWAKQTLSLGNLSKTPPKIIEQIAIVVSAGIPSEKKGTKQWLQHTAQY